MLFDGLAGFMKLSTTTTYLYGLLGFSAVDDESFGLET